MKELIITCKVNDWIEYRCSHKGASEVNLANIKVYEGVFNISWKFPSNIDELTNFFSARDSVIINMYKDDCKYNLNGDTSELIRYAPIYNNDNGSIVYPVKEID